VSSGANEWGGHARPRGPSTPAPRPTPASRPDPGDAGPAGVPPANWTTPDGPEPTRRAPGRLPPASRRRSSPSKRHKSRARLAALVIVAVGVLAIGLATGFGPEPSAEPTAQAFLLDWQQQDYAAAGALTATSPRTAATELEAAFAQVDATQLFLTMDSVVQHGGTAEATFTASVDLAADGRVWTYRGRFGLRQVGDGWKVEWAPSVVYPSLVQGERLAVVTRFPSRAAVLDAEGKPLEVPARVYAVGVWPDRLANPGATAQAFATLTGLEPAQVLGQIAAAPPNEFLRLASLDPDSYASLRPGLRKVPGLVVQPGSERLFQAKATGLVGGVGGEVSQALRADGTGYLPGTTVGLSGLEQAFQRELLGTPMTEVVVATPTGSMTSVLARWPGTPGTPVRTTINSTVQGAALAALSGVSAVGDSGEIVAVEASTGRVLAVAQRQARGFEPMPGAFDAKLMPGTAFTIVSTAALLATGLKVFTPIPCDNSFTVGGQTFTSYGTGTPKPFSDDFADDCGTAFAGLSERLSPSEFAEVVREFGIGSDWSSLPVPAFSGSVPSADSGADLAAETIGQGNVQVSPLSMAMVAAAVDSGSWHAPKVLEDSADPSGSALNRSDMSALRSLMRNAVRSGAAQAASVPGAPVYGQVGLVHTGSGWMSWFVGFRGNVAFTVIEAGRTSQLSAAALAGAFLSALGRLASPCRRRDHGPADVRTCPAEVGPNIPNILPRIVHIASSILIIERKFV
jgi:cell division protein FtsI/penicillin-binding protein 2